MIEGMKVVRSPGMLVEQHTRIGIIMHVSDNRKWCEVFWDDGKVVWGLSVHLNVIK